jgi:hypothetical protein
MARRRKREEAPLSLFSFQDIMACLTGILIMVALLLAIDGLSDVMQLTPGKGTPESAEESQARLEELRQEVATLRKAIDDRRGGIELSAGEVQLLEDRVQRMAMEAERTRRRIQELEAELAERTREREEVTARITELKDRIARSRRQADDQEMRQRVRFLPGSEYSKAPVFVEATATGLAIAELDQSKTPRLVARLDGPDADARLVGALGRRLPNAWYMVFVVHEDSIPRFETLRNAMIRKGYEVGWQLWQGEPGGLFEGARPVEAVP